MHSLFFKKLAHTDLNIYSRKSKSSFLTCFIRFSFLFFLFVFYFILLSITMYGLDQ